MADIVVVVDLPVGSANDIDTTELALLLRDVAAANIIDFADAADVEITTISVTGSGIDYGQDYSIPGRVSNDSYSERY